MRKEKNLDDLEPETIKAILNFEIKKHKLHRDFLTQWIKLLEDTPTEIRKLHLNVHSNKVWWF